MRRIALNYSRRTIAFVTAGLLLAALFAGIACAWLHIRRWRQPAVPLTCVVPTVAPSFLPLDDTRVVICAAGVNREGQPLTRLYCVDTARDTLLHTVSLAVSLQPLGVSTENGSGFFLDTAGRTLYQLNEALETVSTLPVQTAEGVLSPDGRQYYYALSGLLWALDTTSGEISPLATQDDLRFAAVTGIHPTQERLVTTAYTDAYKETTCCAVIDLTDGSTAVYTERLSAPTLFGDLFADLPAEAGTAVLGRLDGTAMLELPAGSVGGLSAITGVPYFIGRVDEAQSTTAMLLYMDSRLDRFGLYGCPLAPLGIPGVESGIAIGEKLLLCTPQEEGYSLTLVDPRRLSFSHAVGGTPFSHPQMAEQALLESYRNSLALLPAENVLSGCRRHADELEQTYGIRILLGEECTIPCTYSDFKVMTTGSLGLYSRHSLVVEEALNTLDSVLRRYPEGFFRQFRPTGDTGGLRFMLTGPIINSLDTVGYAYTSWEWYNIVVNIRDGAPAATLYHEIWHATEQKLAATANRRFEDGAWEACNPAEFRYLYASDDYAKQLRYTYGHDQEVYFVDPYAKIAPAEDRARVMEAVMAPENYQSDALMQCPALRQKLRLLCEAIRAGFATDGWQEVFWERYLS